MKLTVVIVNYNVKYYLAQCLRSLYIAIEGIDAEVVVVDNASVDGSEQYITPLFPNVKYIYNCENRGFACANNQALREAKGEYMLLLNPDTLLPENNISDVLNFMDKHPDSGACGVKMIAPDGSFLPESKRGYPSPFTSLCKFLGMHRLFPGNKRFDSYYLSHLSADTVHSVPVLAGAYMMLRRKTLEYSGLLDEDFFMYGEDIDLSCRISESGYKNYYLPLDILHYKGESTSKNTYRYIRVFYGAMDIFFNKHGKHYSPFFRFLIKSGIRLQRWTKLSIMFIRRTLLSCIPKSSEKKKCFMVFADQSSISSIEKILRSNNLDAKHQFIVVSSALDSSIGSPLLTYTERFTHIVYDDTIFSYSQIINQLFSNHNGKILLGVYNSKSRVLVTPEKSYI